MGGSILLQIEAHQGCCRFVQSQLKREAGGGGGGGRMLFVYGYTCLTII